MQRRWLHRILIATTFFAIIAPTLTWLEFAGGMENFNVATALETVRDGHWAIPTMAESPRLEKPPFVHWLTSLGILSSPGNLAWGARWPSLVAACLALVAVYELTRILFNNDTQIALIAAAIAGSNLLFLKFARQASYDLNLALWVLWTNVCLARWIFLKKPWSLLAAAVCLGIAVMCKGPIAILQSAVPIALFLPIERFPRPRGSTLLAIATVLLIALPWPIYVVIHLLGGNFRTAVQLWYDLVTLHVEAVVEHRTGWHTYFVLIGLLTPWVIWYLGGLIDIARHWRQVPSGLRLAVYLLIVPLLVMEFAPARRDRYLLPMTGPAAIIAAWGVLHIVPCWPNRKGIQTWLIVIHYVVLAGLICGLPLLGMTKWIPSLTTPKGDPWYTPAFGITAATGGALLLLAALIWYRRQTIGFVAGTVVVALAANLIFNWGYRKGEGHADEGPAAANAILSRYPNAEVYNAGQGVRKIPPQLLLIYLNLDVNNLEDPSRLPPSRRAQILIYPPDQTYAPPPRGFVPLAQPMLNGKVYDMYVRSPATQPSTSPR